MAASAALCTIVIFAKAPIPGLAKTRLAPLLGEEGAADLARRMLIDTCREAAAVEEACVELCVTPAPADPLWQGLLPDEVDRVSDQGEGDLGERLHRAAERVLCAGGTAVLIGTDCPELDRRRLAAACAALREQDAFLYPATDGGYALLALRRNSQALFSGVHWSSEKVAAQTFERLEALGWKYALGETLRDVDRPEDLEGLSGIYR